MALHSPMCIMRESETLVEVPGDVLKSLNKDVQEDEGFQGGKLRFFVGGVVALLTMLTKSRFSKGSRAREVGKSTKRLTNSTVSVVSGGQRAANGCMHYLTSSGGRICLKCRTVSTTISSVRNR